MATSASPPGNTRPPAQPSAAKKTLPALPEERFWIRYSPHHELPLSSVSSFAVHALAIGLLLLVGFLLAPLFGDRNKLPVDPVRFIDSGGGGTKGGTAEGPGVSGGQPKEDVGEDNKKNNPTVPVKAPELPLTVAEANNIPFKDDPAAQRFIQQPTDQLREFSKLDKSVQDSLRRGINGSPGQGGTGSDGGKGSGKDKGVGSGSGAGRQGEISKREQRMLRWKIIFDTRSGADWLRQLDGIGAILAIPSSGADNYKIVRDLKHLPAKLLDEDISKIGRIFWFAYPPQSDDLARTLGLGAIPPRIVVFIPEEFEQQMFTQELKYNNLTEEQIIQRNLETHFKLRPLGGGKHEVYVISQEKMH
jgi:hypothetical protein